MKNLYRLKKMMLSLLFISLPFGGAVLALPAQTMAPITGEIETITIDAPGNVWSGGKMTVGGQEVILPANLLINLPNDYQTLQQLYTNAPAACLATGETGLAKSDKCNAQATGAQASILANRTDSGNAIAGVVDIFKGLETVNGTVTYISYTDGYFRLNGISGDAATGVMVRVNDPTSRNTIQTGLGCAANTSAVNCSADVRFKIDPDNYTFCYVTGYPACIPTTANGLGDPNCPDTNRPPIPAITTSNPFAPPPVAADSRHFAPVKIGDAIKADGSFETVGGVKFLSAWSVRVLVDLTTRTTDTLTGAPDPTQPDYLIINDASWDGPAYPAGRVRGRLLTNSTVRITGAVPGTADIDYFSIHYDPVNNAPHEQVLYTTQFNKQFGAVIFNQATGVSDSQVKMDFFPFAKILGNEPCLALLGQEPKATGIPVFPGINIFNYCTSGSDLVQNFNLMVPVFREVMARSTRQRVTTGGGLAALDIHGRPSQSGQYKLPTTINYGAFEDINLGMGQFPFQFSGTPWLMDRRLSPNGCVGACGGAPQPLTPFPFEGVDPRTIAPTFGFVVLGQITSIPTPDRMFRYMDVAGNMTGLLTWPPANAPAIPITPLPTNSLFPPIASDAFASTRQNTPVTINVLANDRSLLGSLDPTSVKVTQPAIGNGTAVANLNGTITYTPPTPTFNGTVTFTYTIADSFGVVSLPATVTVLVSLSGNTFLVTLNSVNGFINGPGTADLNTTPSYIITSKPGFHVADVTVNGVSQGAATSLTLPPVNTNMTITAVFAPNTFTVTKTSTNGAITGPAAADFSTTPVYTITPSTGYHVVDVTVDGASKGAVPSVTLPPVAANVAITASFAINTYTIAATSDTRGTMTPTGDVPVTHGTSQSFSFTPTPGYNIVNVIVDGVPQGAQASFTFSTITGGHSIKAVFVPDGDVNGDGKVDIADALKALQISVGLVPPSAVNTLHGDVAPLGGDGVPVPDTQITAADSLLILKKVVGSTSGW